MTAVRDQQLEAFVTACHKVAGYGLVQCSSGNLSWRIAPDKVLLSGTRTWLAEICPEQVALCDGRGRSINGVHPSVESRFHMGILARRDDVDVVLHFQTPHATALACMDLVGTNYNVLPEIPYYIGSIAQVPYFTPGSEALAEAVVAALADHDLAMLMNHGQVAVGQTFEQTIQKAVFFEMACGILLRAGANVQPLSPEEIAAVGSYHDGKHPADRPAE